MIKSAEDLKRLKEEVKALTSIRGGQGVEIIVRMGTCGIAAGAREVTSAILEELNKHNLADIRLTQTGCTGKCEKEVLVDVVRPGEKIITYGKVKPQDITRIVSSHIINGQIVEDLVVAKSN
ncbi:(2Fe-2S) ferredoxin domain-containing protein [Phosphitispora sp. TUW77]|uniref:(2Fe-2S) ferredoxin domain-containing protein n=1 Tax=Phosphitispora sp. TUW77 TaxID=3152361 RepID=UPI003AB3C012